MVFYLESWGFSFYILPYTSYDCVCYQSPVVGRQREKISNEDLPVFLVLVRGQNSSPSEFWALAQLSLLSPLPLPLVLVWHCQRAKAGEKEERKKKKKNSGDFSHSRWLTLVSPLFWFWDDKVRVFLKPFLFSPGVYIQVSGCLPLSLGLTIWVRGQRYLGDSLQVWQCIKFLSSSPRLLQILTSQSPHITTEFCQVCSCIQ